jgi:hypothetical protein
MVAHYPKLAGDHLRIKLQHEQLHKKPAGSPVYIWKVLSISPKYLGQEKVQSLDKITLQTHEPQTFEVRKP